MTTSGLVSAEWLLENYRRDNVRILDASMDATLVFPHAEKSGLAEFEAAHIPGAQYFDIDGTADASSGLPHTLPQPSSFEATMRSLGINATDHVIVYDNSLLRSAARGWWMLRVMGHEKASVLDGGFDAWRKVGGPVERGNVTSDTGDFAAKFEANLFRSKQDILGLIDAGGSQVVDARGAPRFQADVTEPRPGLASGHIPGAANVPFTNLYEDNGMLKTKEHLAAAFEASSVNTAGPIVTTCGSGITACNLALALFELGNRDVAVYDGSWVEWGSAGDVPIETGPSRHTYSSK